MMRALFRRSEKGKPFFDRRKRSRPDRTVMTVRYATTRQPLIQAGRLSIAPILPELA